METKEDFNLEFKKFFKKYDGYIMVFVILSIVGVTFIGGLYIWESLHTLKEFNQDPLGYCKDLVWSNVLR